jgi:2-iminobutanoate/2-iminopropanoate deaminase
MIIRTLVVLIACIGLNACAFIIKADLDGLPSSDVVHHPLMIGDEAPFPFSETVEVGDLIFVSGMIGNLPAKPGRDKGVPTIAAGGIGPQTLQTLENIETALLKIGADRHDIVKCTIFMMDMAEWPAMNVVYGQFFGEDFPARSALGVSGLAFDVRVEIECIAARSNRDHS